MVSNWNPRRTRNRKNVVKIKKYILSENCPKLMIDTKPKISESTKKDTNKVILLKIKDNQKILKSDRGKERNSMFTG